MVAYLIRRYFVTILLAPLTAYSLIVYLPGGVIGHLDEYEQGIVGVPPYGSYSGGDFMFLGSEELRTFKLRNPWPANYLAYLLDPKETTTVGDFGPVQTGIDVRIRGWHLQGSGAVTGNLGRSTWVAPGVPVGDVIGRGAAEVVGASVFALLLLMIVACFQRSGRPHAHMLSRRVRYKPSDRLAGPPRAQLFS